MKKTYKILIMCLVVCLAVGIFAACENTKFGPIGTTEYKNAEVINNGGLAIRQGGYLYYVNGMDSTDNIKKPEDNYFGKASVKGSIMKSKINSDGTLSETAVVVPKMFYTSAANGGMYIYGEWIYYLSPSTKTDNKSNVLSSQSVAARTKIDGTKTEEIATLSSNSTQYVFTEKAFVYYEDSTLKKVGYTSSKVDKKPTDIAKEVTSVLFTQKSSVVFFTKATESDVRSNNNVFVCVNGEVKSVTTDDTYEGSAGDLNKQFTFALVSYDAKENTLFYTKAKLSNDASKTTSTYGYKFGDDFTLQPAKEKKFSTTALSTFVNLGFDKGLLDYSAAELKLYKPLNEDAVVDETQTLATLSATGAKIVQIDQTYMYYVLSNSLYRIEYNDKKAIAQKWSEDAVNTSWLTISVIDDYMYYIDNTHNYMFRMDLDSFVSQPNNLVYAKGEAVGGTRKATLEKDKEGNIKITYVADSEDKEGVTYYQIPKFMTEADAKTYAASIYKDEDEK